VTATLLWFRQDLRLQDHPALLAAVARGGPVVPVYVLDDAGDGAWPPGGAARWWLHHALAALDTALRGRGSRLVLARGGAEAALTALAGATGAGAVYWNRRYEPAVIARDARIKAALAASGREARSFPAALLFEPHTVANREGRPFQVFTPFWRRCLELPVAPPVAFTAPVVPGPAVWPASLELAELGLLPRRPWAGGLAEAWQPGEAGAAARLQRFVAGPLEGYAAERNRPDLDGTSQLSPWLHSGELGPRQVWAAVRERTGAEAGAGGAAAIGAAAAGRPLREGARVFLSEIGWREFAHHLLFHFPHTPEQPLRADFARFPWAEDPGGAQLAAWQRGRTGYPIVDAGLRQLWRTGWMHNRVRMIAASFLVKHLRLPWTLGAAWFWDTLVDADLASNTLGWQWTAGCGADAAPYFRVFAPVLQGRKFDPDGVYVRRWVPELAALPTALIHAPWEAPVDALAAAGVRLGETYPRPIVDHAAARAAALAAFQQIRGRAEVRE
jgi:deoxyribodipyrimidine photo-lyase